MFTEWIAAANELKAAETRMVEVIVFMVSQTNGQLDPKYWKI